MAQLANFSQHVFPGESREKDKKMSALFELIVPLVILPKGKISQKSGQEGSGL